MMDLLRNSDGYLSLSKIYSAIAFAMIMAITIVELFTSFNFEHYAALCTFTGSVIALAVGRSVANERAGK